jgi:hypothetical protein
MSTFFRKTLQMVIKHPVVFAVSGLLLIAIIIIVLSSGESNNQEPPQVPVANNPSTENQPIQPADPLPGVNPEINSNTDDSTNQNPPDRLQQQVRDLNGNIVPPEHVPAPDIHDYDPETQAQTEEFINSAPAFQKMPLSKNGVYADLEDILPDGRMVILVRYSGSLKNAKQTWQKMLKQYKDSGKMYLVVYRR